MTKSEQTIKQIDNERKHLESLLSNRLNFYFVFVAVMLPSSLNMANPYKAILLFIGTLVSIFLSLAVWRTHLLVKMALEEMVKEYPAHPYSKYKDRINFPPNANTLLLYIPIILTIFFGLLTSWAFWNLFLSIVNQI